MGPRYACVMERNLFTKESRPPSDPADPPFIVHVYLRYYKTSLHLYGTLNSTTLYKT